MLNAIPIISIGNLMDMPYWFLFLAWLNMIIRIFG